MSSGEPSHKANHGQVVGTLLAVRVSHMRFVAPELHEVEDTESYTDHKC